MNDQSDIDKSTKRLEPALRYLAGNPDAKVKAVAAKFKINDKDIWTWLTAHNRGRKELADHVIESVLAGLAAPAVMRKAGDGRAVRRVLERGSMQPPPTPRVHVAGPGEDLEIWLKDQKAEITGRVQTFLVKVVPSLAGDWLGLNQGNRTPSRAKIRRFAGAISKGKWIVNGETVKFSTSGRLLDGQSRLKSIIEANVPAVLEIRAGLPDRAQESMDIGETRKGAHTLEMLGEKCPGLLATALRLIHLYEIGSLAAGQTGKHGTVLENMDIGPLLERHSALRSSVGWTVGAGSAKAARMLPQSETAFFHYLFGKASAKKRDSFFLQFSTGIGLRETSPTWHLRERLMAERNASAKIGKRERYGLVIKAWNAHFAGEPMQRLRFVAIGTDREGFPDIAGLEKVRK